MAKIVTNKRSAFFDEDVLEEELGAETEAERQMKVILKKQLNTNISINEQFSQHRTFVSPSTFNSIGELVHGTCSLEKFKEIEKDEEIRQELQRCGLTDDEITEYLKFKSPNHLSGRLVNPDVRNEVIQKVEDKIKSHNEDLLKPQEFKTAKKLSRHEMEIEKTLYKGCSEKNKLSSLVSVQKVSTMDDTFRHIKKMSDSLLEKCSKQRKKKKMKQHQIEVVEHHIDKDGGILYDPNIHHVIVPLEENEVIENCLSLEEIKNLPRFSEYDSGEPNKTLYLKNLHPKSTVNELRAIFGKFEDENSHPIDYKLCSGRMKGQAFLTFSNVDIAQRALRFANGYLLRGKPIIIVFGKKS